MSSLRELDEASSRESRGKAVNSSKHPNISNGGGNADEADEDEVKEDEELVDKENAGKPPNPATSSKAKKAFGMHRVQPTARKGNDPSNYEDIFPEDPMYAETAPNARVWRTHQAESAIHDVNMVEEIRDNVDVLLVFAGLFSAVVTTFVVQTSQSLQADYVQVSASLLFELLLVQRAIANGSPVNTIPVSSLNPQTAFAPTATDVWVNGLWFTSLFLSLTTALVAVLVKQWLHHYVVLPSGTPRERCFVRQYRYLGFQKWRVEVIVGVLPVLMHLALALFFIGLSLFLHPLRAALSCVAWTGTVMLIVAYVIVTILPMCFPQCPYHTPLCDLAYPPYIYITSFVQKHYRRLRQLLQQCPYRTPLCDLAYSPYVYIASLIQKHFHRLLQLLQSRCKKIVQSMARIDDSGTDSESDSGRNHTTAKPNSLKQLELDAVEKASLRLSVEALQWLFSSSSNPAVQSIVVESIGGLPMGALVEVEDVFRGILSIVDVRGNLLLSVVKVRAVDRNLYPISSVSSGMEHKFERLLRSCMFISRVKPLWTIMDVPDQLDRDEFGATLLTQIPQLCRVDDKRLNLRKPTVFLHDILSLEMSAKFPPMVWKNLIQSVTASWDPDLFNTDDQFPMLLCSAVTRIVRTDIPKQQLFASPLVVDFEQAVEYFPEVALEYMMCWLSRFDVLPGERLECRVLAASIRLMIHRLSRLATGTDISVAPETRGLNLMIWTLSTHSPYCHRNPESVWKILESVIVKTPIFSQNATDSKYDECSRFVLDCYRKLVREHNLASRIHAPSSALQLLVTFIIAQWSTLHTSTKTRAVLRFLELCLQQRFRPAYDAFNQKQCLKFLAKQPVSLWSALLLTAYVTGITVVTIQSRDDPEENQTISQAIDCLHEPKNLFPVCSTLAMDAHWYEWDGWVPEGTGSPDIMTALARIRPLDPAWGNCRQRLRVLAEDENCFVGSEGHKTDIEERRCNIREAIKALDIFFSNIPPQATASLELVQLPPTLLSLDVAEESLAKAAATSVLVRSRRSPATLASTATTGRGTPIDGTWNTCHPHSHRCFITLLMISVSRVGDLSLYLLLTRPP
ncbi:hypothetical protein EV421DRAFT_1959673 [Armillaria borealis]|uniref:DUF6535 domain-containing protein n=1 Tax=Armillaria borealis TaxID=47425 RepID=A0AA39JE03_9AGAR|nr:hypothetical protein EV421DRAFT_1959673 [Armillaria borealis]